MKLVSSLLLAASLFTAGAAFAGDGHAHGHDHKNCACSEKCPHHDKTASAEGHVCTKDCTACAEGKHECNDKTCNHEGHGKSKKSTKKS